MKRTNPLLDERLLEEAVRVLAAKTYSAAVNTALEEISVCAKYKAFLNSLGPASGKAKSWK